MELFEVDDGYDKGRYTRKIPHIQYEPKGETPSVFTLYNVEKYYQFRKEINEKDIPDDIKKFLIFSATRFIEFDYAQIAEFYCHADKDVQELMEKLGLVIIDFDDAMENGFVKLQKNIRGLYDEAIKK